MFDFVIQKMLNCKWIMICLLIGNIFMVSVACANPMYTDAIQIKSLNRKISDYVEENNAYPGTVTVDAVLESKNGAANTESFVKARETFQGMQKKFKLDSLEEVSHYYVEKMPALTENIYGDAQKEVSLAIGYMSDFPEHTKMVSGEMYAGKVTDDGIIDAVISQKGLVTQRLILGEILTFDDIKLTDGNPLKIRISGVFENSREDDLYWVNSPNALASELFIDENLFKEQLMNEDDPQNKIRAAFYLILDCTQMRENKISHLLEQAKWYTNYYSQENGQVFRANFVSLLEDHVKMMSRVRATLRILQVPILILLIAFICMVSGQILEIEKNDIAILKSRGAGKKQILRIYFLQSAVIAGIAVVIGLPFAALLCQLFGSANAFLSFVSRGALSLRLTWSVLGYCLASVILCMIAMIVPVFSYANTSIVEHKQNKNSLKKKPIWKKFYLDVLVTAISVYGLFTFHRQQDTLAAAVKKGAALDPLLYLCSSLFIIGVGLLLLRLLPLLLKLLFRVIKNKLDPAVYAAFLRMVRSFHKQNFIMIFLILTLALGIFNAKAAHTINSNEEKRIDYQVGADVVLQEKWINVNEDEAAGAGQDAENANAQMPEEGPVSADDYIEPDFDKYLTIDGVRHAAKVYVTDDATISVMTDISDIEENMESYDEEVIKAYYDSKGTIKEYAVSQKVQLMGIHTKNFGQSARFDTRLLPRHWYHYLNAISQNSTAVLVSQNFHDQLGYQLGDQLSYITATGENITGIIFGFVDYWPTYNPQTQVVDESGNETSMPNFLIVANLSRLQAVDGVLPYQVWLDVEDSTQCVYDFIGEKNIKLDYFNDSYAAQIDMKNDPMIQGTNGILTMGFIVILILAVTGLLIYWVISVQSRALQFGIFRAMGMTMKEILRMLICEQAIITLPSILLGVACGLTAARLFVPLIQIAYSSGDLSLPLSMAGAFWDISKMFIVVFLGIGACTWMIGRMINRIHISQALKLGED